jgi:hypothetical protein
MGCCRDSAESFNTRMCTLDSAQDKHDPDSTDVGANGIMKALIHYGPGQRKWETKPKPTIRGRGDRHCSHHQIDDLRRRLCLEG